MSDALGFGGTFYHASSTIKTALIKSWVLEYLEYESPVWLRNVGKYSETESTRNICQNNRSQGRYLSSVLPGCEAE
jgi:hypothetical protein